MINIVYSGLAKSTYEKNPGYAIAFLKLKLMEQVNKLKSIFKIKFWKKIWNIIFKRLIRCFKNLCYSVLNLINPLFLTSLKQLIEWIYINFINCIKINLFIYCFSFWLRGVLLYASQLIICIHKQYGARDTEPYIIYEIWVQVFIIQFRKFAQFEQFSKLQILSNIKWLQPEVSWKL